MDRNSRLRKLVSSFHVRFGIALFSAGLLATQVTHAQAETLGTFDSWVTTAVDTSEGRVCGMYTQMESNGVFALAVTRDGSVNLAASDPHWALRAQASIPVVVAIGSETYRGTASVLNSHTLTLTSLTVGFVKDVVGGDSLTAWFGSDVRWSVDLAGSGSAALRMLQCANEAKRAYLY